MRNRLFAIALLALSTCLVAQQSLNNDSVIKLVKAGLSDDLIVSTISASPGTYDTSTDGLIALKSSGASDKVVSAIVMKSTAKSAPMDPSATGPTSTLPAIQPPPPPSTAVPGQGPRVFLTSASKGTNTAAARDQSMEMSKDFERDCTGVRITINQNMADYTVALNHIEIGLFVRDNQIQVANKDGDLISKTKEGGSIAGAVKKACTLILADWAKK
jgi:hypothetical protein